MSAADRIQRRLDATLRAQAIHQANGRGIDAAVCGVRAQALREALSDARGKPLPHMRMNLPRKGED